jgi:hypothetical protein
MKRALVALVALALIAPDASAQRVKSFGPELRPFVGAYVPMGVMRDDFRDAATVGGQAALELSDYWHLVGTMGWTYGKNRFSTLAKEKTYIIHYDVGAEANLLYERENNWLVKPFGGLGVGARTYDYGAASITTKTCTSGYGAIGTELQHGVIALRAEARQYASCFESPITGTKKTRTDGLYAIGFAYHIR